MSILDSYYISRSRTASESSRTSRSSRRSTGKTPKGHLPPILDDIAASNGIPLLTKGEKDVEQASPKPHKNAPSVSFFQLFRFGSFCDKLLVFFGMIFGIITGTALVMPFFFSARLANALMIKNNDTSSDDLIEIGKFYISIDLGFGAIIFFSTLLTYYCFKVSSANIVAKLKQEFVRSLTRQEAAWLNEQRYGALGAQLNENINTIREGIGEKLSSVIRGVSSFFAAITLSFIADWQMALIPLATGPLAIILAFVMTKLVDKSEAKQQPYLEESGAILQETIINVATVQCCNGEAQQAKKYENVLKVRRAQAIKAYIWSGIFDGLTFCVLYLFFAADFCFGALSYFSGRIKQPGEVFIVPNTFFNGAWTLGTVSPYFVAILKAKVAAANIYEKIDREPQIDNSGVEKLPPGENYSIQFQNVHFTYPNRLDKPVLQGLTFIAESGKATALVSKSGGGKSTSLQLFLRAYTCDEGAILINNVNIKRLDLRYYRKLIGYVPQDPVLFNGTIAENIRLGDTSITDSQIDKACRIANAHTFIKQLPDGLNTEIGKGHFQLSGGQKQRIVIARAIVHSPPILLLDEATSALDAHSEAAVQNALKQAAKGRTTIVIAHRLSTLHDFVDKVVVIGNGRVVEEGSPHNLMANVHGFYHKLVQAQQIEGSDKLKDNKWLVQYRMEQAKHDDNISIEEYEPDTTDELMPSSTITKSKRHNGLIQLYKSCHGNYRKLISAIVFSASVGLELFFLVLLQGYMFDIMSAKALFSWVDYRKAVMLFTSFAVCLGIFCFATITTSYILYGCSAEKIIDTLKYRALTSILRKNAAYFDQPQRGNAHLISMITTNSEALKPALDHRMVHVISNASSIITLLVLAFVICWQIASIGTTIVFIMAAVAIWANRKMQGITNKLNKIDESAKYSVEIVENVSMIQLLCRENYFINKFSEHLNIVRKLAIKAALYESFMFAVAMSLPFVSDATCYTVGLWLIYNNIASTSTVFLAATTVSFISWAIQFSSTSSADFMKAKPAAESLFSIIDKKNIEKEYSEFRNQGTYRDVSGSIAINNLNFSYPTNPDKLVASDLNMACEPGKHIALVGPSGGGKSTIIHLLERLYYPNSGKMHIDNTDVFDYNLQHLRRNMAVVSQEPVLFSGTIFESITLGVENPTMIQVEEACRLADIADDIEKLPLKYKTPVGEKGNQLSGGQRQRLAIARAIIRNPQILLLDEATSALDSEMQKAIKKASENRTVITIAHRLATVENADCIYFLKDGHILEFGTHNELMTKNSYYADLVRKQMLVH